MLFNILLFDKFETLDAFGPVEMLSDLGKNQFNFVSVTGGVVKSSHGMDVITKSVCEIDRTGALLVPGGMGTRPLSTDADFLSELKKLADEAEYVMSVCTGSALLAAAGVLDGVKATSNKKAMAWVKSTSDKVLWVDKARWVVDGKYYTSSGVSAGMDMAVGFMEDLFGMDVAKKVCENTEYIWNEDKDDDPFAV